MGFDMHYQAIPDHCALLERSLRDPEFGELLQFLPSLYNCGAAGWQDSVRLEFWQAASELLKQYPGLETRNCYLGRRWDELHFLLSANRREEPGTCDDVLLDKAVRGGKLGELKATQGMIIGYVSSFEVNRVACLLEPMTPADLRSRYVPEKLTAKKVYKFQTTRADESDWKYAEVTFKSFRAFYLETAAAKEGALAILD
jgi:hypothetical protein